MNQGPPFYCITCGRSYSQKGNLVRHLRFECGTEPKFECYVCKKRFKRRHHLKDHEKIHFSAEYPFTSYNESFNRS